MKTRKSLVFTGFLVVLMSANPSFSARDNHVIISSGPIMPAGLAKKPEGFFGNLLGQKYILNDLHIEGVSAFPPGKVFTLYQDYLKQTVDMTDIKVITERIKDLYATNDLPAPKIILPLNRFTERLAVIKVVEPRALRRLNADPATLGEIMKKTKQKQRERAKAVSKTIPPVAAPLSETEVRKPGVATSITTVDEIKKPEPKAEPIADYQPKPIIIESFNVTGSENVDAAVFQSMGQSLVDQLLNIHDVLALATKIKQLYAANGLKQPRILLPLDDLLENKLVIQITENAVQPQLQTAAVVPTVAPVAPIAIQPKAATKIEAEPAKKTKPIQKKINRTEVKRGIFLIEQS